jgi:hypothetical protein
MSGRRKYLLKPKDRGCSDSLLGKERSENPCDQHSEPKECQEWDDAYGKERKIQKEKFERNHRIYSKIIDRVKGWWP